MRKIKMNGIILAMATLASVQRASAQTFTTKIIAQSNPFSLARNVISVTLTSDTSFTAADGFTITISGILGASRASTSTSSLELFGDDAQLFSDEAGTAGLASWYEDVPGESPFLVLHLQGSEALEATKSTSFAFAVLNPLVAQSAPDIFIEGTFPAGKIGPTLMTRADGDLYDVSGGQLPLRISYPPYRAMHIELVHTELNLKSNLPTAQSSQVLIVGSAFGGFDFSPTVRVGGTACHGTVWQSDSSLSCSVPGGHAPSASVVVSVGTGSRWQETWHRAVSFDAPSVTAMDPMHAASSGGTSLTILGMNFAANGYTPTLRIGQTACTASTWQSDSTLMCKVTTFPCQTFSESDLLRTYGATDFSCSLSLSSASVVA